MWLLVCFEEKEMKYPRNYESQPGCSTYGTVKIDEKSKGKQVYSNLMIFIEWCDSEICLYKIKSRVDEFLFHLLKYY